MPDEARRAQPARPHVARPPAEDGPPAPSPGSSLRAQMEGVGRRKAPAPPGKDLAMLVIAIVAVVAAVVGIVTGMGPGQEIRRLREGEVPPQSAPPGPAPDVSHGATHPVAIPEGLPPEVATRLERDLAALRGSRLDAETGLRDLAPLTLTADEATRERLRPFVLEVLEERILTRRLRVAALDAALALAEADPEGLEDVAAAVVDAALLDDGAAAAALVLLDALPGDGGPRAVAAAAALADDAARPLHLRRLAARLAAGD